MNFLPSTDYNLYTHCFFGFLGFWFFSVFSVWEYKSRCSHTPLIKNWLNDPCLSDPDDRTLRKGGASSYIKSFLSLQTLQLMGLCVTESSCPERYSSPVLSASIVAGALSQSSPKERVRPVAQSVPVAAADCCSLFGKVLNMPGSWTNLHLQV